MQKARCILCETIVCEILLARIGACSAFLRLVEEWFSWFLFGIKYLNGLTIVQIPKAKNGSNLSLNRF